MVSLRKEIQYTLLNRELKGLLELKMQGWLIDLKTCDYLLSQDIFKNAIWSNTVVNFWFKLKCNVISCNYTLPRWYRNISQVCPLDGYRIESKSHILNSCKEFQRHHSKRHDKLVDKTDKELQPFCSETFKNKTIGTCFIQLASVSTVKDLKPDLVLKSRNFVVIMDVTCPYDLYMEESFREKISKYEDLRREISEFYEETDISNSDRFDRLSK